MSTNVGSIHYDLKLDTSEFDRKSAGVSSSLKSFGNSLTSIGDKMADTGKKMTVGLTLPIVAGAAVAVKAASDLAETMNKVDVAFGDQAKTVRDWGNTTLKSIGMAKGTALDAAALFGDMATSMGLSTLQASKMSMSLVNLAGDLASFKNIGFEQAQTALSGIFTGETESLKRLGIVMTEVNLEQFAMSQGITKSMKDMTQAEKVNLRYAYVMSVTKNAQGDFARTSESTANQMRYTTERVKELSASFGEKLLPVTGQLLEMANKILDRFSALTPAQQDIIIKVLALAAALGPIIFFFGKIVSSVGTLIELFGTLGPLMANPYFWAVAAVLALIAAQIYLIYKNWQIFKPVWDMVVQGFTQFWNLIQPIRDFIANQFISAWNDIKNAVDQLRIALAPYEPQLRLLAQLWFISLITPFVVITAVIGVVIGILAALIAFIARLVGWLVQLGVTITQTMINFINWANTTRNNVINAFAGIVNWVGILINNVASIPGRIWGVLAGMGGMLYGAGVNAIRGLWQGISDMAGAVYNKAREIANNVANTIKSALRIKSPSRVMMGIGTDIGKGLEIGMESMMPTISAMAGNLATGIEAPIGGTQINKQNTTTNNNNIYGNITLGDSNAVDRFFDKLNRNGELSAKGMTTV